MLTDFQTKKILAWFDVQDLDKNGLLEEADYALFAQNMITLRGFADASAEAEGLRNLFKGIWQALQQMGRPASHQVTRDEFMAGYDALLGNPDTYQATIAALTDSFFSLVDADHDGQATIDEISSFYLALGMEHVQQHIHAVDVNQDGVISRDEFQQLIYEFYGDDPEAPGSRLIGQIA